MTMGTTVPWLCYNNDIITMTMMADSTMETTTTEVATKQ